MIRERASCDEHAEHRRSCGKCAEAEVWHIFPGLDDWQREVAATPGLEKWRAGMQPVMSDDDPVEFTLAGPYMAVEATMPELKEQVTLKGPSRRHLLIAAQIYAQEQ